MQRYPTDFDRITLSAPPKIDLSYGSQSRQQDTPDRDRVDWWH